MRGFERLARDLEVRELEAEQPRFRVAIALHAALRQLHVVLVPPARELVALRAQLGHELVEPRVVHVAGMCDAQLRDDVTGMPFPVDQHAAHARIREQPVDAVPLETVRGVEVIVYDRSRTIPCEEVPSLAMPPRGAMSELLEQTAHARSHAARMGVAVAARLAVMPREREEVLRLAGLEPQCRGDPLQ